LDQYHFLFVYSNCQDYLNPEREVKSTDSTVLILYHYEKGNNVLVRRGLLKLKWVVPVKFIKFSDTQSCLMFKEYTVDMAS
jgi:hypothetical protein